MTRCLQMYAAGWGPLWAGTSSCYWLPPSPPPPLCLFVSQNWSILCKLICMRFRGHGLLFTRNCNKVAKQNKQTNRALTWFNQFIVFINSSDPYENYYKILGISRKKQSHSVHSVSCLINQGNLVPRAFPLKNGWEKPWGRGCNQGSVFHLVQCQVHSKDRLTMATQ